MKIDRLIGILSVLLQRDSVTAPELAEKFEVSRRTINRDIDALCLAGVPIVTKQGKYGGISVMDGYKIDKTLLTFSDMQAILAGLKSLDSVSDSGKYRMLIEKLSPSVINGQNGRIMVDLASWHKDSIASKIEFIENAIDKNVKIKFNYFSTSGNSERCVEPYLLIFHWSSWYLWGYCDLRSDYRMFKLNRTVDIEKTDIEFTPRKFPLPDFTKQMWNSDDIYVEILFDKSQKWRLVDEFGIDSFVELENEKLLFKFMFFNKESLFGWLMSFGNTAELILPEKLRTEFLKRVEEVFKIYNKHDK